MVYSFKGRVQSNMAKPSMTLVDVRDLLTARLSEAEGCNPSDLVCTDGSVKMDRNNGHLKVVDLSSKSRWAYRRMVLDQAGTPTECDQMSVIQTDTSIEVYFARHRIVVDGMVEQVSVAPDILRTSALQLDLGDGLTVSGSPHLIPDERWAKWLWSYMESPQRLMTICLIVGQQGIDSLNLADVAFHGFGFCHVVVVPQAMSDTFRRAKLRYCDCHFPDGSVSFIYPGWTLKKSDTHAAMQFSRVREMYAHQAMQEHGLDLSPAFETNDQVFKQAYRDLASTLTLPNKFVTFSIVEEGLAKLMRERGPDPRTRIEELEIALASAQSEAEKAKSEIQTWQALCTDMEKENVRIDSDLRAMDGKLTEAKAEVTRLRDLLWEQKPEVALVHIPIPDRYDLMDKWCQHHLKGKLVLHPRAVRELKDAQYRDVELVYKSLLLLGNQYRDMRLATGDASKVKRRAFTEAMAELHLGFVPTDTACRAYDGYDIEYPLGSGRTRTMESHLKRGKTFDPSTHLRVYFIWDEEEQVVVVGSLPKHLQNHLT